MTNKEALEWLTDLRASLAVPCGSALSEERNAFAEAVDVAIDALDRDRWISVEERLPDKPGDYLVIENYWGVATGIRVRSYTDDLSNVEIYAFPPKTHKRSGWYVYDSEYGYFETGKDITHWMPLPEPPKEET